MINKKHFFVKISPILCSAVLLALPSISRGAGTMSVGTGFDFSSGDYGETTTTDIYYVPINFKYQTDSFAVKMDIPYISIHSDGGNVVGDGSYVVVLPSDEEGSGESSTESGLGDIVASATYFLYEGSVEQPLYPMIDLTGKVKIPTADEEKGLGTGEADYSIESDFTWFSGQTALFCTLGYRFMGDPEAYDLNDVMYASFGVAHQLTSRFSSGILYDVREASSDSGSATSEATAYGSYKMNDNVKFLLYGVKGFSDGSPDYGLGFTVTYSMDPTEIDWLEPVRRIKNL
jgi:hypothetical protein